MTIKELLKIAAEKKASDLHLVVGIPPVIRIDGDLKYLEEKDKITAKEMEAMIVLWVIMKN